jgi:hypothetical protein
MTPRLNLLEAYLDGRTRKCGHLYQSLREFRRPRRASKVKQAPEVSSAARDRLKAETLAAYGGSCRACGEADPACLSIDHIRDNGAEERRKLGRGGGANFYRWLRRWGFPADDYQLLCQNCQFRKRRYGPDFSLWPKAVGA